MKKFVNFALKDADKVPLIIIKYINVSKYNVQDLVFSTKIILMKIKNALINVINHTMKIMNIIFAVIKLINAKNNLNSREYVKSVRIQKLLKNGQLKMALNFLIRFTNKTPKDRMLEDKS